VRPVRLDSNHEFRIDNLHDSDAILGDDRVTRWLSFDSRTREQQAEVLTGAIERAQQTHALSTTLPSPRTPMIG
jgi:ribosomal-protein-alanine N-acetyltransferase